METILFSNGMQRYKFEARNPKTETNPNNGMTETKKKPNQIAGHPVLVIVF